MPPDNSMLWECTDKRQSWEDHIKEAAAYYRQKYHVEPTAVLVHPTVAPSLPGSVHGLAVRPQPSGSAICIRIVGEGEKDVN